MDPWELVRAVDVLSGTPRIGWLQRGIRHAETVGEHVMLVSLLSLITAETLRRRGMDIDVGRVTVIALSHDVAEAYLGHASEELRSLIDWRSAEASAIKRWVPELAEYYMEYREARSPEGVLVAFMDKYATLLRACSYGDVTGDLARAMYSKLSAILENVEGAMSDVLKEMLSHVCGRCATICVEKQG